MMRYSDVVRGHYNRAESRFNDILRDADRRAAEALREAGRRIEDMLAELDDDDSYFAELANLRGEVSQELARLAGRQIESTQRAQREAAALALETAERIGRDVERRVGVSLDWSTADAPRLHRDVTDAIGATPYGSHPLSERIWTSTNATMEHIFQEAQQGILLGQSPLQTARAIRQDLLDPTGSARAQGTARGLRTRGRAAAASGDQERARRLRQSARDREQMLPDMPRGVYRSAAANAARVTRTESIRVYQEATYKYAQRKDWCEYLEWIPNAAACPLCVNLRGIYRKSAAPYMPHPHCMCKMIPVPGEKYAKIMGIDVSNARQADNRMYWVDWARTQAREAA
jgi:hypothetical protein